MQIKLIALLVCLAAAAKTPYDTLGLSKSASAEEIRAAFIKLSMKYHPDRNVEESDRYTEIVNAYSALKEGKNMDTDWEDEEEEQDYWKEEQKKQSDLVESMTQFYKKNPALLAACLLVTLGIMGLWLKY